MFWLLLKKQFMETFRGYLINNKTGKRRSTLGTIGYCLLFATVILSFGFLFFGLGIMLSEILETELAWLFYTLMGIYSIMLSLLMSVFIAHSSIFKSKDNEMLLALPIKPGTILLSRIVMIYLMSFVYSLMTWVPTIIVGMMQSADSFLPSLILLQFIIPLFVTGLACLLAYLVGVISSKIKIKSLGRTLITLIGLGFYYVFCFRINDIMASFVDNAVEIGGAIKAWASILYHLGHACLGSVPSLLIFAGTSFVLFGVCYIFLSRSFISIATTRTGEKKTKYQAKEIKSNSVKKTLILKELKRFTSSTTYMLNCGLGIIILLIIPIAMFIKLDELKALLSIMLFEVPILGKMLPVIIVAIVSGSASTIFISTPSVSLEGKNIWILQSLPVDGKMVLNAKLSLHYLLAGIPTVIAAFSASLLLGFEIDMCIFITISSLLLAMFGGSFGLLIGTLNANLNWTNEAAVIKQGMASMISMFGMMLISFGYAGLYFLVYQYLEVNIYIIIWMVVLAFATRIINRIISTKGAEVFMSL